MIDFSAIAIPIFTSQLEKSKESVDISNVRAAYAEVVAQYLLDGKETSATVTAKQGQAGWQGESGTLVTRVNGSESTITYSAKTSGNSYTIKIAPTSTSSTAGATVTVQ